MQQGTRARSTADAQQPPLPLPPVWNVYALPRYTTEKNHYGLLALALSFSAPLLAVVFGHLALRAESRREYTNGTMARWGLGIGYSLLWFWFTVVVLGLLAAAS